MTMWEGPDAIVERMPVLALLNQLPPRRRAVLVLRYCCDLSIEETARTLGCSAGTVKSQSSRALATLRDLIFLSYPPGRIPACTSQSAAPASPSSPSTAGLPTTG